MARRRQGPKLRAAERDEVRHVGRLVEVPAAHDPYPAVLVYGGEDRGTKRAISEDFFEDAPCKTATFEETEATGVESTK